MKKEVDEDVYSAIKEMAENIDFNCRNYNDELIAIEYYKNLHALTTEELDELITLWERKTRNAYKEMLASRWMIAQVLGLIGIVIYIAWLSVGQSGAVISGIIGLFPAIAILQDGRPRRAKRNWQDSTRVYQHLSNFKETKD